MQEWQQLMQYIDRLRAYENALNLYSWDNAVTAPEAAGAAAAPTVAFLSREHLRIYQDETLLALVEKLMNGTEYQEHMDEFQKRTVKKLYDAMEEWIRVPEETVEHFCNLQAKGYSAWLSAKQQKNFSIFLPVLKELIVLKREIAAYSRKENHTVYDTLLLRFEPDFTTKELTPFFKNLEKQIVPLRKKVLAEQKKQDLKQDCLSLSFDLKKQEEWNRYLARYIGFDFQRGVMGESEHPFTLGMNRNDVRFSTHYYETDVMDGIFSTLHEGGHALYEQGNSEEISNSIFHGGASNGMHEAMSRMYENIIGRSKEFWEPLYPRFQTYFPKQLTGFSLDSFLQAANRLNHTLIRTASDELSYGLHIIIRYEIEKKLFDEEYPAEKLPKLWKDLYGELLGEEPENDAEGILQDMHWSDGSFGYFPSYVIGNAYGAQIFRHLDQKENLKEQLRQGNMTAVKDVLTKAVFCHGAFYSPKELLEQICKEEFDEKYYIEYLKARYSV